MKEYNLQAKIRRKKPYFKNAMKGLCIQPNILKRNFNATKPNEKWVTDITYLIFNGNRMYLSVFKDLYNNIEFKGHYNCLSLTIKT